MIRKFARRLTSLSAVARRYWAETPARPRTVLGVDVFEDRVVPAVTTSVANGVLTIAQTNGGVAFDNKITLAAAAGNFTVTANNGDTIDGGAGPTVIPTAGINTVRITGLADAGFTFTVTVGSLAAAADLRTLTYAGTANADTLSLAGMANANVFTTSNLGGGIDAYTAPDTGVGILAFPATPAAGSFVVLTPSATNAKVALDFRAVTSSVQVNLKANAGSELGSYTNQSIFLAAGSTASTITGVYGGSGDDTLIGNDQPNILIGGLGSDQLIGNGGNDQLNATRDFSPAFAGTPTNGVNVADATTLVDLTRFTTAMGQNMTAATANGSTTGIQVSIALYNQFGFFNFGEGVAFTAGGNITSTGLGTDFTTANNLSVANASADRLFGGIGDDGLYGFNNTAATSFGEGGNDVISSNTQALAATLDGGDNDDLIIGGVTGFTLQGQGGSDTFQFAPGTPSAVNTVIGGPGNDIFQTAIPRVTLDASQDADTFSNPTSNIGIVNDASVILTTNASTVVDLSALPLVQKTTR